MNKSINIKVLEIRDRATYIPVFAIKMQSDDPVERYHLGRTGYGEDYPLILVVKIDGIEATYDPYKWGNFRTMGNAHLYIQEHFDELNSGDVADVEFILGESQTCKRTERLYFSEEGTSDGTL